MSRELLAIEDLDFVIFDGQDLVSSPKDLSASVFSFWKREWTKVFAKIDPESRPNVDDFFNQDLITAILYRDQPIAFQSLRYFSLADAFVDPYFKPYTVESIQALAFRKVSRMQAMQHFIVGEDYGARQTGMNIGAILLGLNFRNQISSRLSATIGLARKDVPVASTLIKFNMNAIGPEIKMHKVPVAQMACFEPAAFPRVEVMQAIDHLWHIKQDYTVVRNNLRRIHESGTGI